MSAWRMSIWCWVVFVVGMVGMVPAMFAGVPVLVVEQAVTWAAFGYGMYLTMVVIRGGDRRLAARGVQGTARVLSATRTNTIVQQGEFAWNAPYVWKYDLEVTVPGREPYPTLLAICAQLPEGATIPVRVSRLNGKRVTIDHELYDQQHAAAWSGSSESLGEVVAALSRFTTVTTPSAAATPLVADELAKLAALKDQGLITEAEFAAQKAKLLGL